MSSNPSCAIGSLHVHDRTRFESRSFELDEPTATEEFSNFIGVNIDKLIDEPTRNVTSPIIVIIEKWREELRVPLLRLFPQLPCQQLAALEQSERSTPYSLPSFEDYYWQIKYTGYHIGVLPRTHDQIRERCLDLGSKYCLSRPIVVYTRQFSRANVVVLVGSLIAPDLMNSVKRHYSEDSCRRWKRLGLNMMHLIPDLFYLFTDWNSTLSALKDTLRDAEARSMSQSLPVTVHTRLLHHQISNVIELRESLRFHQAVIEHTIDSGGPAWGAIEISLRLDSQLQRMKKHMVHSAITLDTIKDQFANLIQLDFNLATVSEGQSVSRLSNLAFIYIPLTYVATLLAIPDIGIQPIWYPIIASPLLLLSICVAFFTDKLVKLRERRISPLNHGILRRHMTSLKSPLKWRNGSSLADVEVGKDQTTVVAQQTMFPATASSPIPPQPSMTSSSLESLPRFVRDAEGWHPPARVIEATSEGPVDLSDLPRSPASEAQEEGKSDPSSAMRKLYGDGWKGMLSFEEESLDAHIEERDNAMDIISKEQNRRLTRFYEGEMNGPEETPSARPYLDRSDAGVASSRRRRSHYR